MKIFDNPKRVLVTRQFEQSGSFINLLSAKGHYPFLLPMIETVQLCPKIEEGDYEVIFFTSANAVKYFAPYHHIAHGKAYIALGEKTAQAMEIFLGVSSHITPTVYNLENALKMMQSINLQGGRILSPGAEKRLEIPEDIIKSMGAELLTPAVYETSFAVYPDEYVDNFISSNKIDIVTFCSPSAAKSFLKQYNGDKTLLDIVSIGTTTALFLDEMGVKSRYPEKFTVDAMVEII